MKGRNLLGLLLIAGVSGCGSESAERAIPVAASVPPAEPSQETPSAASSPTVDLVLAYTQAEAALQAQVMALANDAVTGVIAANARRPEDEGPELVWYPTLHQVAARQREVTYGTPEAGAVQRGSDPLQPFLVEIIVPCQVRTRSGEGVAYPGGAPVQTAPPSDRMLPQATVASDSVNMAEELRSAVAAAMASCAAAEPVSEMVRVTLQFAFQRDQNAVVLLRHARNDARAP